ncbi:DUF2510 domain-containing protein [Arthrobacter sp. A5]|uniref:DUF2510 domain-containing protein n=1 Tax=Arthrobacter sp. A5 TaxID=576926 RepID=UPI003DA9A299
MLAPKEEKALYAYAVTRHAAELDPRVIQHPVYGQAAAALLGLQHLQAGNNEACVQALQSVIHGQPPIEANHFMSKYLPHFSFELEIAGGVTAQFPMTNAALTLALVEALQSLQRIPEAIEYVEGLNPTYPALLSLAELYSDQGNWSEVIRLTDSLPVDSELTGLLAILRSQAHFELDQLVAAKECLKPLTASKKYSDNLRFKALALRSNISLEEKAYARAIADLEKILAENSQISGIREAIADVHQAREDAEQLKAQAVAAKAAETLRIREEKGAEAQRLRDEKTAEAQRLRGAKAAEALRLREEKAAAKLALNATPVMQTSIINLSDDLEKEAPVINDKPASDLAVDSANEPGFYPDPEGAAPYRYWDGKAWTSRVRMTK